MGNQTKGTRMAWGKAGYPFHPSVQKATTTCQCLTGDQTLVLLMQDVSVPQAWFAHFYAIGAACNAALLLWMLQRHQSMVRARQPQPEPMLD